MIGVEALLAWARQIFSAATERACETATRLCHRFQRRYTRLGEQLDDALKDEESTAIFTDEEVRSIVMRSISL